MCAAASVADVLVLTWFYWRSVLPYTYAPAFTGASILVGLVGGACVDRRAARVSNLVFAAQICSSRWTYGRWADGSSYESIVSFVVLLVGLWLRNKQKSGTCRAAANPPGSLACAEGAPVGQWSGGSGRELPGTAAVTPVAGALHTSAPCWSGSLHVINVLFSLLCPAQALSMPGIVYFMPWRGA